MLSIYAVLSSSLLNLLQLGFHPTTHPKLLHKGIQDLCCQTQSSIISPHLHGLSAAHQLVTPFLGFCDTVPAWLACCLSNSASLVLCAGSFFCPRPLNTGDLIQSHSFNECLMLKTPTFVYPAQDFFLPWTLEIYSTASSKSPPGHLKGTPNLKCSNWATLKHTLQCPPYLSLLQFHPFSCSGQKPWCHPWFLSYPISNLLANATSSTFKILSESKAFFPAFTASTLPQATTIACLNYSCYPRPSPAQPILHPAVRTINHTIPSAHHLHWFPIALNQAPRNLAPFPLWHCLILLSLPLQRRPYHL